jgi:hypothetical protein
MPSGRQVVQADRWERTAVYGWLMAMNMLAKVTIDKLF